MEDIFRKFNQYLFFFVLAAVVLFFGKPILIPVAFAALLSMLMAPVCRFLDRKGFRRGLACLVCIVTIAAVIAGMLAVVGGQISAFRKEVPKIKEKVTTGITTAQDYVQQKMGVEPEKQEQIAKEQIKSSSKSGGNMIKKFFAGLTSTIAGLLLTLVFTFLMLYNKEQFENFFLKLYKDENQTKVRKVVDQISTVGQKYLTGRLMSVCIIAALYAVGLSIVGIKNAILLAGVAAMLTVIPYLGTILGGLFPVLFALATEDSVQPALWAGVVLIFIQAMDNYFIEPNIVGGEVNLNALTSIISIIVGGLVWGVAGMILFLPMAGIIKIICDHVEDLKPVGYIMGEPGGQKPSKIKLWIQEKIFKKKK